MLGFLIFEPFILGIVCALIGKKNEKLRDYLAVAGLLIEAALAGYLMIGALIHQSAEEFLYFNIPEICGFGLHFTMDGFRAVYAFVAAWMWLMCAAVSREYFIHHSNRNRFYLFLLLTMGATMGVFLSADLFTTFIFFEIMSFTSYVWVAQEENYQALRAGDTYLAVAVIGGLVMLMGLFLLYNEIGTLDMKELLPALKGYENRMRLYTIGVLLFTGFGAKAGAFPLHIWLPKAHPVAPAPASALLSGILTKSGIFGILVVSCNIFMHDSLWGQFLLMIGVFTMVGGAVLGVFSVDLKRTLACSSMSQIGFILIGIGMQCLLGEENAMAVYGTMFHMVNHSMIKLVLFLSAAVVYMNLHVLNLNDIRGFGRKKPLLMVIFLAGALCISGIPGFGGYISKTLLHESIVEYGGGVLMKGVEYIFIFSGGLTLAYMTKLFVCIFVEKNTDSDKQAQFDEMKKYMSPFTSVALTASAILLFVWGFIPKLTMLPVGKIASAFMNLEDDMHAVHFYSFECLSGAFISIAIGVLVYTLFVRLVLMRNVADEETVKSGVYGKMYMNRWPYWFDIEDKIYRPILLGLIPSVAGFFCRILDCLVDEIVVILRRSFYSDTPLPGERLEGTWLTEMVGEIANCLQWTANHTFKRKKPTNVEFVHLFALRRERLKTETNIIERSFSFALFLFCIGFAIMFVYIIFV